MNLHSPCGSGLKISWGMSCLVEKFDLWIRPPLSIDGRSNCSNVVSSISTAVHMESDSNCNKRLGASAWSSECQFTACVVCNELELSPISLLSSLFAASHPSPPRAENLLGNELFGGIVHIDSCSHGVR